jgi:hypothetical protein
MANQSPDRRQVLEMLAKVAAISQFPGFCKWAGASETRATSYEPIFFTPAEFAVVDQLTEIIIPRDEHPGAREAGVAEFIDLMVARDPELQFPFRRGLTWLDASATSAFGRDFMELPAEGQEAVLRRLAYKKEQKPEEREEQEFFRLMRKYTVMGYYTSRMGLEALDYPGLKFYTESGACPHKDDPEHRRLS